MDQRRLPAGLWDFDVTLLDSELMHIEQDSVPGVDAVSAMKAAVLAVPLLDCPGTRYRRVLREGSLEGLEFECLENIWRSQW